jgi:acid phosphatase (class B)
MHQRRGDTIVFITDRPPADPASDALALRLQNAFKLPAMPLVVFTDKQPKTKAIQENHVKIYYGDSDGDIKAANEAHVRAVRVIRPKISSNPSPTHNGQLGEPILDGSDS